MIELVSVEVTNFRSFSHAFFSPLGIGQGMTAINGQNGMGKSSIVHAIVWALYGVTPDGVRVGALRRQGSEGDVEVKIIFRHDGQNVEVVRALRGRNDTTIASISVDDVEQTNVSAKTATNWVSARLGLDSDAFLIAFVVRQKELDNLVRARPADRRKTIERLAGIERMSAALDRARQDSRQAQRLLDALPEGSDPVADEAAAASAGHLVDHTSAALEKATQKLEEASEASSVAEAEVASSRAALEAVSSAKYARDLADQKIDALTVDVDRLEKAAVGAGNVEKYIEVARTSRETLTSAEQTIASVAALINRANSDAARAASSKTTLDSAEESCENAKKAFAVIEELLADFPEDLETQANHSASEVSRLTDERGAARGEWDRLKKAIETLNEASANHGAECPTCAHPLADTDALVTSLTEALNSIQERGRRITEELKVAEEQAKDFAQMLTNEATLKARLSAGSDAISASTRNLEKAQEAFDAASAEALTSAKEASTATSAAESATSSLPNLKAADAEAQAALRQAEGAEEAAQQLVEARKRFANAETALAEAEDALKKALERAGDIQITQIEQVARTAQNAAQVASDEASQARTANMLAQRDLEAAEENLKRSKAAADSRKSALAEVERTTAVSSSLDEFRRDRLARLTPELSEVASDFVSRMTDGKYTSVMLDEDFTPVLTDASGAERPVAWLSGGEESAVALALRVAIGEVLAGQRGGLLILDEVLTAQDQNRRQATMAAIRALPRQVITINHISEATDMVDLVAEVISDGEGASTLLEIAPEGPVGANVSDALLDAK
jgi:exonuclease SbcC